LRRRPPGWRSSGEYTSDNLYIGTSSAPFIQYPPDPILPVVANFTLEVTNGSASVPLPLKFELAFSGDAHCCLNQAYRSRLRYGLPRINQVAHHKEHTGLPSYLQAGEGCCFLACLGDLPVHLLKA
jgi:hypothetical protein